MNVRSKIGRWRYRYGLSSVLVTLTRPIYQFCGSAIQLIQRKIKVNGKAITYYGHRIQFPKNVGILINSTIYWKHEEGFEPLTGKTLLTFFASCEVFLDIGSNFGFYSVLAQKANQDIRVLCFEPLPNIYQDNLQFHKTNHVNRQKVFNVALSNSVGTATFYVPDVYAIESEVTSASIEKDFFYNQKFPYKEINVDVTTLDHILQEHGSEIIGKEVILKIDVEGHELKLLEGADLFLRTIKPFLVMEIDKNENNAMFFLTMFDRYGYCLFGITHYGYIRLKNDSFMQFNGGRDYLLMPAARCGDQDYFTFESLKLILR